MDKWYVAAMNDCIFIVDQEPRPAPVDHVNPNLPAPSVVISMRSGSREAQEIAERVVREHNASIGVVAYKPDSESLSLVERMARLETRFQQATTHDEVADLVWACRAMIDANADAAPFFAPESIDKTVVYTAALGLYFEHAQRILGRSPWPAEVDKIETGFCNPWLEKLEPERMERGRQLLTAIEADQSSR